MFTVDLNLFTVAFGIFFILWGGWQILFEKIDQLNKTNTGNKLVSNLVI